MIVKKNLGLAWLEYAFMVGNEPLLCDVYQVFRQALLDLVI